MTTHSSLVDRGRPLLTPRPVQCTRCHRRIVFLPDVGSWVDPVPLSAYDVCEQDPYGNHWPDWQPGDLGPLSGAGQH